MALSPVAIPLTFSGGVDTKTDSKSVATTQLISLENGQFAKGTTIVKRTGYDALPKTVDGGGEYTAPVALAGRGDELCLMTATDLYSYRESSESWSRVGPVASIVHTERPIAATGTDQSMPDMATASGVSVLAWEDSRGGVWWAVVEQATQRILRAAEQLATGKTMPRVVHVGAIVHIYVTDPTGGQILCYPVSVDDYDAPLIPTVIATDLSMTAPHYDAVRHDDTVGDFPAVLVYTASAGTARVGYVDAAGTFGPSSLPAPEYLSGGGSVGPVAVSWLATTEWGAAAVAIARDAGGVVEVSVVKAGDLASSLGGDNVFTATPVRLALTFDAAGIVWVWSESASAPPLAQNSYTTVGTVTYPDVIGPTATLRGHGLVSRAFTDASGPCVAVVHEVPFFPYVAICRTTDAAAPTFDCIARLVVGSSDGLPERGHLATVEQDADDPRVWRVPLLAREQVDAAQSGAQFSETGIRSVSLDFDSGEAYQAAEFGRDLIVGGAVPLRYDGDTVAELGFHTAPDGTIALTESTAHNATEMAASSTYLYQFCYEERDAAGEIHLGPMSVPSTITLTSAGTGVTIAIPTYRLTSKRRVSIAVWRSEADDTTGDPLLYRVTSLDPSAASGANRYVENDVNADTATFLDEMPDATLITRERAYTNSGVLSNDPIGLGHIVVAAKDRLFFNDPTDAEIVRFTQKRLDGRGPEVCADLSLRAPLGEVVALAELDDSVLVFAPGQVGRFSGDGPLSNPDAAPQISFTAVNTITGDVGCASARSLAITPDRVLFKSARGIYQIDRSQQVAYVGAPVEGYNAQAVTSADAVPGKTQILFLTPSGMTLLYDYFFGQWSTYTNHAGADALVVAGSYHYLRAGAADGRVFRSNPTSYLDGTSEIRLHLETAWVKLLGYHQGLQKIWHALFLGTYRSPHLLRIRIAADYQPGWLEPYDLDVDANYVLDSYGSGPYGADVYGGDSDTLYQRRIHVGMQCQAIRFSIEDVTSGTPLGASFELTELLLTGGARRASASFGNARSD